ncbi:MAG: hypothetical protein ACLUVB_04115 [Acutalibacteraceae bacterium]
MATLERLRLRCADHREPPPVFRNGLKFFTPAGGLDSPDISEILKYAEAGEAPAQAAGGAVTPTDYMTRYAANLREMIKAGVNAPDRDHPLEGFKIVVDAGNGAGGFYATEVLEPLGADITGSQFLEPDGRFPNHIEPRERGGHAERLRGDRAPAPTSA